jgi:sirohydrochlorin ferrochelatase
LRADEAGPQEVAVGLAAWAGEKAPAGGEACVAAGAGRVVMVPYFLSAGMHVVEDLTAARDELAKRHPDVTFVLTEPLGRHPLIVDVVAERAREALSQ